MIVLSPSNANIDVSIHSLTLSCLPLSLQMLVALDALKGIGFCIFSLQVKSIVDKDESCDGPAWSLVVAYPPILLYLSWSDTVLGKSLGHKSHEILKLTCLLKEQ